MKFQVRDFALARLKYLCLYSSDRFSTARFAHVIVALNATNDNINRVAVGISNSLDDFETAAPVQWILGDLLVDIRSDHLFSEHFILASYQYHPFVRSFSPDMHSVRFLFS